ncbi:hypothetical protein NYE40_23810 [Paenibacillus sp. FSL W8-1187]|uniref:hypothetical protein n=1 Tax=Paenibacillus sp. FSL W8-1187 TaxID=2975339 RepID=UPI0030D7FC77
MLTSLLVSLLMPAVNLSSEFMEATLTIGAVGRQATALLMNAVAASFMDMIPLYFGMRKYSTTTTVASSILIVFIVCSGSPGGFSLNSIIAIPIALFWIGAIIAYASFRNIERQDVAP